MIKLVATDIDGTLVKDGANSLNPELFDVILNLRKKGIQFAAASGRQYASIERLFEPIKEKIFYIADNGAYVGCYGRNLFLNPIDLDCVKEMITDIRNCEGLELMVSGPNVVYMETADQEFVDWMRDGYRYQLKQVSDLTQVADQFTKLSVYKKDGVEAAAGHLIKKYQDRLKITISGHMWMDFMAIGVNKGWAIETLQESLGISPEETMTFGDQLNDIEMLGKSYYSFAIGNARAEVKAAARFQADRNDHDGVMKILKQL